VYIVVAISVIYLVAGYVRKAAERRKEILDEKLAKTLALPLCLLLFVVGFYLIVLKTPSFIEYANVIDRITAIVIILVCAEIVVRIGNALLVSRIEMFVKERPEIATTLAMVKTIWGIFVWIIALIIVMSVWGIEVGPLLASLGIIGLAVALAFQETLQNFFAGFNIAVEKKLKIGDYIKLSSGEEGRISYFGWRSTTLKEASGGEIIIPNAKLAQTIIKSYSSRGNHVFSVPFAVSPETDLERLEQIVIDVATRIQKKTDGAVKSHIPSVVYTSFDKSAIEFNVVMCAENFSYQAAIRHSLIKAIQEKFKKGEIEIPHFQGDIYIKRVVGLPKDSKKIR
jgi:small-conductance mechanosensitive channel